TKHDSENIYVLVKDTGEGVSPANLKRIFDPFFTTKACKDKKKNEETGGTGLGLYTSKLLLKSYHADISAKSSSTGSLFTISIPKTNALTQRG
ncbi:MAG: ATP-binding protein, partial [Deltaproteobacteria bacterium]|nr:ATP-binding protein [Deltaproteobacteria bacterium]